MNPLVLIRKASVNAEKYELEIAMSISWVSWDHLSSKAAYVIIFKKENVVTQSQKQKDAMDALKQKYLQNIPDKIAAVRKIIATNEILHLEQEFHKINGSGKTYGYEAVSLVAFPIERHCKNKNPNVFALAELACQLLQKVYDNFNAKQPYEVQNDPLFKEIQ
jgi:HPt (histidine-containing phosphotransfer) domain-containing protein